MRMPGTGTDLLARTAQAAQLSLGLVFLLAFLPKLRAPGRFARTVAEYRLVPAALAPAVARALIGVEALLALTLLTGTVVRLAAPLALATFSAFTAAVGINLLRNRKVPCGCFGAASETISGHTLSRLALLVLAAAFVTVATTVMGVAPFSPTSPAGGPAAASQLLETVVVGLGLLLVGMWASHLPEVWSILGSFRRPAGRPETSNQRGGEAA
jgi:hypothetical protein